MKYSSSRQSTQGSATSMGRTSLEISQHLIRTIFSWGRRSEVSRRVEGGGTRRRRGAVEGGGTRRWRGAVEGGGTRRRRGAVEGGGEEQWIEEEPGGGEERS